MRENPIPLLALFLLVVVLPTWARGQNEAETPTRTEVLRAERERIKKLTAHGPHRKNPLAAGRMLVLKADITSTRQIPRKTIREAERRNRRSTFTSLGALPPVSQPTRREEKPGAG